MEMIVPDDKEMLRIGKLLVKFLNENGYTVKGKASDNGTDILNMENEESCGIHIEIIPWDMWTEE